MRRRTVLSLTGSTLAATSAGCTALQTDERRLWFLRLHNNTFEPRDVGMRVLRGDQVAVEERYTSLPGWQDMPSNSTASFGGPENTEVILPQWETNRADFQVEYTHESVDGWNAVPLDAAATDIGVELRLGGGGGTDLRMTTEVITFDSKRKGEQFVAWVRGERAEPP